MFAIVEIAGQQFKVEKDTKLYVNRLAAEKGTTVEFDQVMLVSDNGDVKVGAPVLENVKISAEVQDHVQGDKVQVFKKKRRKGYQKQNGHRDQLTKVQIKDILV